MKHAHHEMKAHHKAMKKHHEAMAHHHEKLAHHSDKIAHHSSKMMDNVKVAAGNHGFQSKLQRKGDMKKGEAGYMDVQK